MEGTNSREDISDDIIDTVADLHSDEKIQTDQLDITMDNMERDAVDNTLDGVQSSDGPRSIGTTRYESDLQHIDDLIKKYQLNAELENTSQEPSEEHLVNTDEGETDAESVASVIEVTETDLNGKQCVVSKEEVDGSDLNPPDVEYEKFLGNDGDLEMENNTNISESPLPNRQDSFASKKTEVDLDSNANLPSKGMDLNVKDFTGYPSIAIDVNDNLNLWQNDFHPDSETFQIFKVPSDYYSFEYGSEISDTVTQSKDVDFSPDSESLPDEIKINTDCDKTNEPKASDEVPRRVKHGSGSSVERQVELYTRWHKNLKNAIVPYTCSCSSYNVFSMARKLAVLTFVLITLLYTTMVPDAEYDYDITKGLGPQALYYYKLSKGKKGYHQVSNLLFDTGQIYPPPKKEQPTDQPSKTRKRKRKRRKVPSNVRQVLPLVMRQQVETIENGGKQKLLVSNRQMDSFQGVKGPLNSHNREGDFGAGDINRREGLKGVEPDEKDIAEKLQVNHYYAGDFDADEFYKIFPGNMEAEILLRRGDCGEYCMFRINYRKLPDGLTDSRMVLWSQWKGQYKLKGLEKSSTYQIEICQYGNNGSTRNCKHTEVEIY